MTEQIKKKLFRFDIKNQPIALAYFDDVIKSMTCPRLYIILISMRDSEIIVSK